MLRSNLKSSAGSSGRPDRSKPETLGKTPRAVTPWIKRKLPSSIEKEMVCDFLQALDTPRALTVWLLYKYGEHRTLVELGIDPLSYNAPELFRRDYAATKFLSKHSGLKTGIDTKEVAISAANAAEDHCRRTNEEIRGWRCGLPQPPLVSKYFFLAQRKIADILGPIPPDLSDESIDRSWSNGRTTSVFGDDLSSTRKYSGRPDVTYRAMPYVSRMVATSPIWGAAILNADAPCSILPQGMNIVKGNVQTVVPKNAKTDRVICYEPHLNIRVQLALGSYIARRLMKFGVNLRDQDVNRRRAYLASKTGHLATVDLKSASDTICRELVYELLPFDWAYLLDCLRSSHTQLEDGSFRRNEKFSSMGNGFTFELESLIFYALARSVTTDITVFGDDIILPTSAYNDVAELLGHAGFTINTQKSYNSGWFRESCGMDAFRGVDCTPPFLRASIITTEDATKLHNAVYAWCGRTHYAYTRYHALLQKWREMLQGPLGPKGYGEGHLHACFHDAWPSRASAGWDGWWYTTYLRKYRCNLLGDESGVVNQRYSYAALCAVTGPKRIQDLQKSEVSRGRYKCYRTRSVASSWPSIDWV